MLPTDKSKPSTANVTVTPIPSSATTATDCNTLSKLLIRKNAGSRDWKKKISAARTKKMAYRRRKYAIPRARVASSVVRLSRTLEGKSETEAGGTVTPGTRCGSLDVFESFDRETSAAS